MGWTYFRTLIKLMHLYIQKKSFWTYREFPKHSESLEPSSMFRLEGAELFAIVMQGPVIRDTQFTIETLALYRKNFPEAILILSTWEFPEAALFRLKDLGVHLIKNEKPENPGIQNTNLQIVTSRSGIRLAKKLGAEYALKTRTDQRIYHPSLGSYLINLIDVFPLTAKIAHQKKRLVGISLNSFKYRMYGVSDMFLFGHINDMSLYWDIPLDERIERNEERENAGRSLRKYAIWRVCEVYFCTEFLKRIGRDIQYTLSDSFEVLSKHFVIIDKDAVRIYWHKYSLDADRYVSGDMFDPELSFNDWLMLYQSAGHVVVDEDILDVC